MATVLLLDDEVVLRSLLAALLEEDGHTVIEGSDGLLAYDPAVLAKVDLMITDLYMPKIDGMEAIITARRDRPDLRIIGMSAGGRYLKRDFLPVMKDFGASAILRKPFKPNEFLATVHAVLAMPASAGEIESPRALAS